MVVYFCSTFHVQFKNFQETRQRGVLPVGSQQHIQNSHPRNRHSSSFQPVPPPQTGSTISEVQLKIVKKVQTLFRLLLVVCGI